MSANIVQFTFKLYGLPIAVALIVSQIIANRQIDMLNPQRYKITSTEIVHTCNAYASLISLLCLLTLHILSVPNTERQIFIEFLVAVSNPLNSFYFHPPTHLMSSQ